MYKKYKNAKRLFIPEKQVKTIGTSQNSSTFQTKLDAMESIRNDLGMDGIEVPGVIVVGSQSSGKSSVLESLSGIRLPSGTSITTRVPLILRLEKRNVSKSFAIIHDTADLTNGEHINDLQLIPSKIEEYTTRTVGDNGAVKDNPIHLKVIQADGPTITVIDLPGITHMSIDNVQKNIHAETVNLVKKYIGNEHMIILCVVPAMDDFANAEAIKISKEIDIDGHRTIGVITKIDICPDDVSEKITADGRNVSLELGYVAVKNRSPKETDMTTRELRKAERTFFENSPFYNAIDNGLWGMDTLIEKIVALQTVSINSYIPKRIDLLHTQVSALKQDLNSDEYNFSSQHDKFRYVTKCVLTISERLSHIQADKTLHVLFTEYGKQMGGAKPDFFNDEYFERLKKEVKETAGVLPNFLCQPLFEDVLCDNRQTILDISQSLISSVSLHVKLLVGDEVKLIQGDISSFIHQCMLQYLDDIIDTTTQYVKTILESEHVVFTQNNGYINEIKEIRSMAVNGEHDEEDIDIPVKFLKRYASSTIGNDTHMVCELQASLYAYTNVHINRLSDTVPMIIMHHIQVFTKQLSNKVIEQVRDDVIDKYMEDDSILKRERTLKEDKLSRYEKALTLLSSL